MLWLLNVGASYQSIYHIVGVQESKIRLLFLAATAQFVNTVMPAVAGATAAAVFLTDGRRRGHSVGRVMAAWALFLVFDYAGLLFVVTLGLVVLDRRNIMHWGEDRRLWHSGVYRQRHPVDAGPGNEVTSFVGQSTGRLCPLCKSNQPCLQPQRHC
jgi:uncharacterized membrane protein YbhN (UPF0104 family)